VECDAASIANIPQSRNYKALFEQLAQAQNSKKFFKMTGTHIQTIKEIQALN
jgi:hypothetical protein